MTKMIGYCCRSYKIMSVECLSTKVLKIFIGCDGFAVAAYAVSQYYWYYFLKLNHRFSCMSSVIPINILTIAIVYDC
jgi:hypothetical protein